MFSLLFVLRVKIGDAEMLSSSPVDDMVIGVSLFSIWRVDGTGLESAKDDGVEEF